jgi:isoquinoline 1-oxidoreductase alpha subunit
MSRELHVAMTAYQLDVNGERREVTADPSTPLLWVLREELKMTGTKYGCGIGACGACTGHLGGVATRSCLVPAFDRQPSNHYDRGTQER